MLTALDKEVVAGVVAGVCFLVVSLCLAMAICFPNGRQQQEATVHRRAPRRRSTGGGDGNAAPPPTPVPVEAAAVAMEAAEQGQAGPLLCTYLRADGWQDAATCGVCLAELADGDALMVLPPCMHYFHAACVGDWIRLHATCPFCRAPVAAARPA